MNSKQPNKNINQQSWFSGIEQSSNIFLKVLNIRKSFGKVQILNNLSFEVTRGSFHMILGENGSGKSTIIKILIGAFSKQKIEGSFAFHPEAKVAYVPTDVRFPVLMTVKRFLLNSLILSGQFIDKVDANHKIETLLKEYKILDRKNIVCNKLSSGQKKKVMIIYSELFNSNLLILDEPTANMDIESRLLVLKKLKSWCDEGKTVVIVSHLASEISELATEATVLHNGYLVYNGALPKANAIVFIDQKIRSYLESGAKNG